MAVKNTSAKNWPLVASFDGYFYSAYPNGDKPSGFVTTPTLLGTDIVSGSTTGFENNKGCYLSLFGYSFGQQSKIGLATGARVYMRDSAGANTWVEVDNYRALIKSRTWSVNQIVQLIVQVGALGGKTGNLDIKVTVNGVDSNILANQFYVQPGRCAYVSTTGNDATAMFDDITKPFRYAQNYSGNSPVAGSLWAATTTMGETGLRPGDTICLRAGTYTDQTGWNGRWIRFKDQTGTAPTGTAGAGYYHITRYPGAAGANSPEVVFHNGASGAGGGIHGVNTANAGLGNGKRYTISGLKIYSNAVTLDTDSAPINLQQGADYCRVTDCELSWPGSTQANLAAGISCSQGNNQFLAFNYIHDITGSTLQNHGIYHGSYSDGGPYVSSNNNTVCYNWIKDITGGNGYQFHAANADGTSEGTGNVFRNNYIDTVGKIGINLVEGCKGMDVFNNIVLNCGYEPIRMMGASYQRNLAINVAHNTFYRWGRTGNSDSGGAGMFVIDYNVAVTGTIKLVHNIGVLPTTPDSFINSNPYYNTVNTNGGLTITCTKNLYYDKAGLKVTRPSIDDGTSLIAQDPLFTSLTTGDVTLLTGSPALNAATGTEPVTVSVDFYGIARPQSTNPDIGATEGVGT